MNRVIVQQRLQFIVAGELKIDPATVVPSALLRELGAGHDEVRGICLAVEESFGIRIDFVEHDDIKSFDDLVGLTMKRLEEKR